MSGQYKKMEDTLWMFSCSPLYIEALKELSNFHTLKAKYLRTQNEDHHFGLYAKKMWSGNEEPKSKKEKEATECQKELNASYSRWLDLEAKYYEWKLKKYKNENDSSVRKSFAAMRKSLDFPWGELNLVSEQKDIIGQGRSTGELSDSRDLELWRMHGTEFYARALKILIEFKKLGAEQRKIEAKYPEWDLWQEMTESDEKKILSLRKQRHELKAKWCDLEAAYYAAEAKKESKVKKALNSSIKKGYGAAFRNPNVNSVDIDAGMFPQMGVDNFSKNIGGLDKNFRNIDSSQAYKKEDNDRNGSLMIVCIGFGGDVKTKKKAKKNE